MRRCEFCGTELPTGAGFCGHCGRFLPREAKPSTESDEPPTVEFPTAAGGAPPSAGDEPEATIIRPRRQPESLAEDSGLRRLSLSASLPEHIRQQGEQTLPEVSDDQQAFPLPAGQEQTFLPRAEEEDEEEEEEKRRRALLFGPALPFAISELPTVGQVPTLQGAPPAGNVPIIQGAPPAGNVPSMQGGPPGIATSAAAQGTLAVPQTPAAAGAPIRLTPHPPQRTPRPAKAGSGPPALLVIVSVALVTLLLLSGSAVALSLTAFAPSLAVLSGSTSVAPGGALHLHGEHFLPGASVGLTLDNRLPLQFSRSTPSYQVAAHGGIVAGQELDAALAWLPLAGSTLRVKGDGTFDVMLTIDPNWTPGKHSIRASEQLTPRSATMSFTILGPGATPTTTPGSTSTPATATATATPSPGATTTGAALSCVNPNAITLGPVSTGYNRAITQGITLCASGSGALNWTASWDTNRAPWLRLDNTSGMIQAPGQQQVMISANAGQMASGTYSIAITFSAGGRSLALNVSFSVRAACISASPASLSFNVVSGSNLPARALAVTNCGGLASWRASLQLETTQQWLSLSASSGTLNAGADKSLNVAIQNIAGLGPGTYRGKILLVSGASLFTVNVSMTLPQLLLVTPQPPMLTGGVNCQQGKTGWTCFATIESVPGNQGNLTWSSTSSLSGVTFSPSGGTLTPGQEQRVLIQVPPNDCQDGTFTFAGPANTQPISWKCIPVVE